MTVCRPVRAFLLLVLASVSVRLSESLTIGSKATSRRAWLNNVVASCSITVAVTSTWVPPAFAVTQEDKDKANILKGYQRLNYLLDNWEEETTVCNTSNDNPYLGCDRSPIKVMAYLGYKNTQDPLFKADKAMLRLQQFVPAKFEEEYLEAMDTWVGKFSQVLVPVEIDSRFASLMFPSACAHNRKE